MKSYELPFDHVLSIMVYIQRLFLCT